MRAISAHSARARVALAFVVGLLCVGASACSSTNEPTQSNDAGPDGSDLDATLACGGGKVVVYWKPGCGAAAEPVCDGPTFDGCAGSFCDCDGHTFWGGCGFSTKPFASFGACPGDPDGGP